MRVRRADDFAADPNVPFERGPDGAPPSPQECPAWLPAKWHNSYPGYLQQWTHNVNLLRFFLSEPGKSVAPLIKSVQLDNDGMTGVVVLEINGVARGAGTPRVRASAHGADDAATPPALSS